MLDKLEKMVINAKRRLLGQKPLSYWKDSKNLEKEIKEVVEQIGYFPTQAELRDLGRSNLVETVGRYPTGLAEVREKMGYEAK